jgi:putative membrane protein
MPDFSISKQGAGILFLGLISVILLVVWQGVGSVVGIMSQVGWGILWLFPLFFGVLLLMTRAWQALFVEGNAPSFAKLLLFNWIGNSINWLLPVAQLGGDFVKAWWLARQQVVSGSWSAASVIVDKTIQAMVQAAVAMIGIALLASHSDNTEIVYAGLIFVVLLCVGVTIFYRLQRSGLFFNASRLAGKWKAKAAKLSGGAEHLDATIEIIYQNRRAVLSSFLWRLVSRLILAAEIWLALGMLGISVGAVEALLLECLGQTVRAAAFMIPGAYGIQEGGYMTLGLAIGLPLEVSLSLSLIKRLRELMVGVPALVVWQWMETSSLAKTKSPSG